MVALSEAARVAFGIFMLAGVTVGSVALVTYYAGPNADSMAAGDEEGRIFLVNYPMHTAETATDTYVFSRMGNIVISGIEVPMQNVTSVEVTLQVAMGGPAFNDQYTVTLYDPTGAARSGSHTVPNASPAGYIRSDNIISWSRTPHPTAESHRVDDPGEAARRSAANHTDPSAVGNWSASIALNQPVVGRDGNASLHLTFRYYEAIVLPEATGSPTTTPTPTAANQTNETEESSATTGLHTTGAAPQVLLSSSALEPTGDVFEAVPRTFIMAGSVGSDVDRGRTAHRPL